MNIAAVPEYVRKAAGDFTGCPPGHYFNLYFPTWKLDWQLDKNGKAGALRRVLKLGCAKAVLDALCSRQMVLAEALPANRHYILDACSTAPFATGLGLEHPIENGFAFLSPYGLPYLAGSGVKGVLRRAAEDLCGEANEIVKALFGHEDANDARRGALTCWDVFPIPPENGSHKDSLVVEIMTPHFSDYYQDKGNISPHDAGKPNPIPFLAVPAGSKFRFVITCETALLTDAIPDWKVLLSKIIEYAFDWLGFGAKTAVGYGAMQEDEGAKARQAEREREAAEKRRREQKACEREAELARMSPALRAMHEFLDARVDKNQTELSALLGALKQGKWDGEAKVEIARHVEKQMRDAKKWKEKSAKKRPEKDHDYQDTLKVMVWLQGK